MKLKVLLPSHVFAETDDVTRIVAETREGSFGLLPRRLDCVAALVPGILLYETPEDGEVCIAVDEGVLVKSGADVLVSVRRAMGGIELARLRETVEREFIARRDEERALQRVMAGLESDFLRRLAGLGHA